MKFEWSLQEPNKFEKRGIDFDQAQAIWDDEDYIEIPAKTSDELRWIVIGKIDDKCWSAVVTYRGDYIRIISVRRTLDEEIELYESLWIWQEIWWR